MSIALLHKLLVPETELTNFVQKLPNAIGSLVAFIETLSPVKQIIKFIIYLDFRTCQAIRKEWPAKSSLKFQKTSALTGCCCNTSAN